MSTFEHGSIAILKNEAKIFLSASDFDVSDLKNLKAFQKKDRLSLDIETVEEEDSRIVITYTIPEHFLSLKVIQKESLPVRLSVLNTILKEDPLNHEENISIHPSTLFFRPMSSVRYTYKAYGNMPKANEFSAFTQYKSLVLAILTNQSYEAFLKNGEAAYQPKKLRYSPKERKDIERIIAALQDSHSFDELKQDIQESTEYAQFSYFGDMKKIKDHYKRKLVSIGAAAVVFLGAGIGATQLLTKDKQDEAFASYEKELQEKNLEIQKLTFLSAGDYKGASKIMAKQDKSPGEISALLIKGGEYQSAIDQDPESLEQVIEMLYSKGEEDAILELRLKDNRKLSLEQAIVANDTNRMISEVSFLEDKGTATRMGKKLLEGGDVNRAKQIADTYALEDLHKLIQLTEKENQLISLNKEMEQVNENTELSEEDKEKQLKHIETRIDEAEQDIIALKEELDVQENTDEV